jgi:sigma-B regulation protein RsbU (phosphoserine phosphatase)
VVCGKNARFLEAPHGTPLGAMSNVYREGEFDLLRGETIVLYTDGLTEARRGADFFGEHRLLEALSHQDCTDVQQLVKGLVSTVTDHAGGRLADDLAVIAVHLQADGPD